MLTRKYEEPRMVFICSACQGKGCEHCYQGRCWETDEEYAERMERIRQAQEETPC